MPLLKLHFFFRPAVGVTWKQRDAFIWGLLSNPLSILNQLSIPYPSNANSLGSAKQKAPKEVVI